MPAQLDFIIYGVPRSGTKGLVRGLNLHPHVYCAMERFHFRDDHTALTFPDSFLDARNITRPKPAEDQSSPTELAKKGNIRLAGNKFPRYYFGLDRINRELPNLRNIWIYRSPYEFMPLLESQGTNIEGRPSPPGRAVWPSRTFSVHRNTLALPKDVSVFP